MTLKRWKFCLLTNEKELLYVLILLTLKLLSRTFLVCDKQYSTRALEIASYTAGACHLSFWVNSWLQDSFAHLLWHWGFSVHRRDVFILWIFVLAVTSVLLWNTFALLCTREPAKLSVLLMQKFLVKTTTFSFPARQAAVPMWNLSSMSFKPTLILDLWCLILV